MGKGIAKQFRDYFPQMYYQYHRMCDAKQLRLGDIFIWYYEDTVIFNVMTQIAPYMAAKHEAIHTGLEKVLYYIENNKFLNNIAMRGIGCGLGGLTFDIVQPIIEDAFKSYTGKLTVYEYI